jgi:aminoglycoside N3'-acetyltransferase
MKRDQLLVDVAKILKKMGGGAVVASGKRLLVKRSGKKRIENRKIASTKSSYTAAQLVAFLRDSFGVFEGDVLLVQSSFQNLHGLNEGPGELIEALCALVGETGAILMPAHPLYRDGTNVFDPHRTPTYAGLLCETFRRWPGVLRSIHPTHSVCGIGERAFDLLRDHSEDLRGCGPNSPYFRLIKAKGHIVTLGLPPSFTTFLHTVEDVRPENFPVPIYDGSIGLFEVREASGRVQVKIPLRSQRVLSGMDLDLFDGLLGDAVRHKRLFHNELVWHAQAGPLYDRLVELCRQGVTVYDF